MNAEMKAAFTRVKPVCDVIMVRPSPESVANFVSRVSELKKEVLQELQQYLLFPFITHVKPATEDLNNELLRNLVDAMRVVLEKVNVNNYEMCLKMEILLLQLLFDKSKPGMVSMIPEELKLSVMKCLTVLMLHIDNKFRRKLLKTQITLLGQVIYISVQIAKLERLRALRYAAIECLTVHAGVNVRLTENYRLKDESLEQLAVEMIAGVLPGVIGALQDVAVCTNNPGNSVIVAAIDAIHRVLCLTLADQFMKTSDEVSIEDFAAKLNTSIQCDISKRAVTKETNSKGLAMSCKNLTPFSPAWYSMADQMLQSVTIKLYSLRTHENFRVRKVLAVYALRVLTECARTMQESHPIAIDILVTLSKDEYPAVAEYCTKALEDVLTNTSTVKRIRLMEHISNNFFDILHGLPRILNNIHVDRKLSALNSLCGYLEILCEAARPQRLRQVLSSPAHMRELTATLTHAAELEAGLSLLTRHHAPDVNITPPESPLWISLTHLDDDATTLCFRRACAMLGACEAAELILDRLLELFARDRTPELVYIMNSMAAGSNSASMLYRLVDTYIEVDLWYLPLEVSSGEQPPSSDETLDVTVYNPRAWTIDSVPGLYEGTVETRYTDISLQKPREPPQREPNTCLTLAEAQQNMLLSCLLTDGVGTAALGLGKRYQKYLLKTLCLILERVGSRYEMLHLAGIKALRDIARACGHDTVPDLIRRNVDYFTYQVTVRLKKCWDNQAALDILSVVMEYSDPQLLDSLFSIVRDVLVQSCDKYYERNLYSYLQVFLTFVECMRKWFHIEDETKSPEKKPELNIMKDLLDYIKNVDEAERLMREEESTEDGKSVEEMFKEDLKKKEDDALDYDDKVTEEAQRPVPQYVAVSAAIVERCVNFAGGGSGRRDEAALALRVVARCLPLLAARRDTLLPLVHRAWAPLAARFQQQDLIVMRCAIELLITMAIVAKDFIRSRCEKEVLPHVYRFLVSAADNSRGGDASHDHPTSGVQLTQAAALRALGELAPRLALDADELLRVAAAATPYLRRTAPHDLQALAVRLFVTLFEYDNGTTWLYLRALCGNDTPLAPPPHARAHRDPDRDRGDRDQDQDRRDRDRDRVDQDRDQDRDRVTLRTVRGTPFDAADARYNANIAAIFATILNEAQ